MNESRTPWWAVVLVGVGGLAGGTALGFAMAKLQARPLPTGIHRVSVGNHVTLAPGEGTIWKHDRWDWKWHPAPGSPNFDDAVGLAVTRDGEGLDVVLHAPGVLELDQLYPNTGGIVGTYILATPGIHPVGKG
jgi:hypothetical protein